MLRLLRARDVAGVASDMVVGMSILTAKPVALAAMIASAALLVPVGAVIVSTVTVCMRPSDSLVLSVTTTGARARTPAAPPV